jgi:stage II sporulation protein D
VGLVRSPASLRVLGWRGQWDLQGAEVALGRLGLSPVPVEEGDLAGFRGDLLVLANVRCLSEAGARAVEAFVAGGGRVLATYMTSYRDPENRPWNPNNFRLAGLFGADFSQWVGAPPAAANLVLEGQKVQLARHQAMLVKVRPGARVLATWDEPPGEAAVVEAEGTIYVGEDLLAPENSASPQVLGLLGWLVERLLPGWKAPPRPAPGDVPRPPVPVLPLPPSGPLVRVGLEPLVTEEVRLVTGARPPEGRGWADLVGNLGPARPRGAGELRARPILTRGKPPAVALYSGRGELLLRSAEPLPVGPGPVEVRLQNPNGTFRWSACRGSLLLVPTAEGLRLVNQLSLEEYLAGVVPNEMPPWFPPESLKAMAVVARTFTLSQEGRHGAYDLCPTVHCQVYGGLLSEAPSTTQAVAATAGQVLLYQGEIAATPYHAACGGVGEDAHLAWPEHARLPYLSGRADTPRPLEADLSEEAAVERFLADRPFAYCQEAARFRWEQAFTARELQGLLEVSLPRMLGARYRPLGDLRALRVVRRTPHGRVSELILEGSLGRLALGGDQVRWMTSGGRVGTGGLPSNLFVVAHRQDRFVFSGGGWGHGVGLCQEGAAGRARAGQTWQTIVEHYYPGAGVGRQPPWGPSKSEAP